MNQLLRPSLGDIGGGLVAHGQIPRNEALRSERADQDQIEMTLPVSCSGHKRHGAARFAAAWVAAAPAGEAGDTFPGDRRADCVSFATAAQAATISDRPPRAASPK